MIFEDQGITYNDVRIPRESWPALKKELVESGRNPSGQLPIVEIGGQTLSQSFSIHRFFARIFGKVFRIPVSLFP